MSIEAILDRTFLFGDGSLEELGALAAGTRRRRYARGEAIFREGDPAMGVYVIEEGRVKVVLSAPGGEERILALLGPGEVLGELEMLDGRVRCTDVVACEDSVLVFLGREAFVEFLLQHSEAALRLARLLSRRLRSAYLQVHDSTFYDVRGRLAQALLQLGAEQGERKDDGTVLCPRLSQSELAHLIGATRESVNKWLRWFEHRELIRRSGGQVMLLDRERLEREVY